MEIAPAEKLLQGLKPPFFRAFISELKLRLPESPFMRQFLFSATYFPNTSTWKVPGTILNGRVCGGGF